MELTLLHLYPDSMNLYGEYANLAVLRRHLEALGVSVTVRAVTNEDVPDFAGAGPHLHGSGHGDRSEGRAAGSVHHRRP